MTGPPGAPCSTGLSYVLPFRIRLRSNQTLPCYPRQGRTEKPSGQRTAHAPPRPPPAPGVEEGGGALSNCTLSLFRFPPPRSAGGSDATEGEKPPRAPASDRGGRRKRTLPVLSAKPKESPATALRSQKNAPLCHAHYQPEHRQHGLCPSRLLRPERRLGFSGRNDDSASQAGTTTRLLRPERRIGFSGRNGRLGFSGRNESTSQARSASTSSSAPGSLPSSTSSLIPSQMFLAASPRLLSPQYSTRLSQTSLSLCISYRKCAS